MSVENSTDAALLGLLETHWGYNSFRPLQREAMECVLERRHSVVVLPTGGGKSLCYQVPAVSLGRLAVVVSPLISLMKDQVDALTACGVPAACVNSSHSMAERQHVANEIRAGRLRLLYVAPERLMTGKMLDFLSGHDVAFFAIDEAHCISHWGHDFRPEYRQLKILKERFPQASLHAFTATATRLVREDIADQLGLDSPEIMVGDFDRPNLTYRAVRRTDRMTQVLEVLDRHQRESGIIYCISRRAVNELCAALQGRGFKAVPYHAGLSDEERHRNQDAFLSEKVDLVVATVAFGMGIDKPNVRFVLHTGMPKSVEHYQQEAGRAGRDGLESECVLLYAGADIALWKKIMEIGPDDLDHPAAQSLNRIANYCASVTCRHQLLVEHFGQPFGREGCEEHCDACLDELRLVDDAMTLSRKILSGIVRTEQRYGAAYVAGTLVGDADDRARQRGHDRLSTFGLLKEYPKKTVRGWIDQLVGQGYLARSDGDLPTLQLTETGRSLLKGEGSPKLLAPEEPRSKKKKRAATVVDDWEGVDRDLYERLKQMCTKLAREKGVSTYIIFGDTTLRDLARQRPSTSELLLDVKGIGEKKRKALGDIVLAEIAAYCEETGVSRDAAPERAPRRASPPPRKGPTEGALAAYPYFRQGLPIADIAELLGRADSTVEKYLMTWIAAEKVSDPSPWVAQETAARIREAVAEVGDGYLKPIREYLGEDVSYEAIRVVVACEMNVANTT